MPDDLRVLLVDDHDLFRTGLRNLLEDQGLNVVGEAANGAEAAAMQSLIDTFRVDAARIVADIDRACVGGDVEAFEEAVRAMILCTQVFGVSRVRDILGSMATPTPAKLRLQGADFVHRLESELARLDAAVIDYLKTTK